MSTTPRLLRESSTTVLSAVQKYLAAIIMIAYAVISAVVDALKTGPVTADVGDHIVIIAIGAVLVYWVPLLNTKWAGLLKVIAAGLTALASAVEPFIRAGHWPTGSDWITIGLGIASALGVGIGASVRADAIRGIVQLAVLRTYNPVSESGTTAPEKYHD